MSNRKLKDRIKQWVAEISIGFLALMFVAALVMLIISIVQAVNFDWTKVLGVLMGLYMSFLMGRLITILGKIRY